MDFSSYEAILRKSGSSKRERIIRKSMKDTMNYGPDSPAYKSVEIEGVPHNMMIISSTITNQKIIRSMPGDDFEIGKIMLWSKSHWLITERDADDEITVRGKIELCNRSIQWQNDDTKKIITRWAVVDKPYFSNLNENNLMTLSSREFQIKIPYDSESSLIDIGKRLMLEEINGNPKTYRVTCVDAMTERYDRNNEQTGFLTLNLEQDQYDPSTDNKEHMICDYESPHKTSYGSIKMEFSGNPVIRLCGRGKLFRAKRDNKNVLNCQWEIVFSDSDISEKVYFDGQEKKSKVFNGETCRIVTDGDISINGEKFTLIVRDLDGGGEDSVVLEVVDL